MESVLVVGRIKGSRRRGAERILGSGRLLERLPPGLTRQSLYRQGDTIALLFEGPQAEQSFLRLLQTGEGSLPRLIDCLEEVPLLPRELSRLGPAAGR